MRLPYSLSKRVNKTTATNVDPVQIIDRLIRMLFCCIECYRTVANQLLTVTMLEDALEKLLVGY
jgi:hypothetical protein